MNQPIKKLSAAPIRINTPEIKPSVSKSNPPEESRKQDFRKQDFINQESGKQDLNSNSTNNDEQSIPTAANAAATLEAQLEIGKPREYDRISMRILAETKKKLINLKNETGVPYEILVEVMIKNWEQLSDENKANIIKQSQSERNIRLLEGKQKSMRRTMEQIKNGN